MQRFLLAISLCGAPTDALQVSVTQLSRVPTLHETLMAALWEGILLSVTVSLVEFRKNIQIGKPIIIFSLQATRFEF